MIDCQKTLEHLEDYLSQALSEQDLAEVKEHLRDCGRCLDHYGFRERFLALLREKAGSDSTPAALRAAILEAIRTTAPPRVRSFALGDAWNALTGLFRRRLLASAATVLAIVLVGALLTWQLAPTTSWASDLIQDHFQCWTGHNADEIECDSMDRVDDFYHQHFRNFSGPVPGAHCPQLSLIRAHICRIHGSAAGHLLLNAGDARISCFFIPDPGMDARQGFHAVAKDSQKFLVREEQGPQGPVVVVMWPTGNMLSCLVTQAPVDTALTYAQQAAAVSPTAPRP